MDRPSPLGRGLGHQREDCKPKKVICFFRHIRHSRTILCNLTKDGHGVAFGRLLLSDIKFRINSPSS